MYCMSLYNVQFGAARLQVPVLNQNKTMQATELLLNLFLKVWSIQELMIDVYDVTISLNFSRHRQTLGICRFSVKSLGWNKSSSQIPKSRKWFIKLWTRTRSETSISLGIVVVTSIGTELKTNWLKTRQRILPSRIHSSKSTVGASPISFANQLAILYSNWTSLCKI